MKNYFILCLILIMSFSCQNMCPEGYEHMDKECYCPDDKFEVDGTCRTLNPNEYYAISDCFINDTSYVEFVDKKENTYGIKIERGSGKTHTGGLVLYEEYPEFDSLYYEPGLMNNFLGIRDYNGQCCVKGVIRGRLTDEGFVGFLDWYDEYNFKLLETCPFEMITKR